MSAVITIPVVIIGNGPSGLSLSHILSGNWPYYNGQIHPDELLQNKLNQFGQETLLKQNLEELSDGLNGRSSNPVAVLFDQLHHPNADLGLDMESCLTWRFDSNNTIPHLVLGKYSAGGSWRSIHKDGRTLGYSNWLELPGYRMRDWLNRRIPSKETGTLDRLDLGLVRHYYADYAKYMQMDKYLRGGVTVRSVRRYNLACNFLNDRADMNSDSDESCYEANVINGETCKRLHPLNSTGSNLDSDGEEEFDERSREDSHDKNINWIIDVEDKDGDVSSSYKILASQVVLATGVYDIPKTLNIPGEGLPFVYHRCPDFKHIDLSSNTNGPILVIGSGLSAGDTILAALENGFNVAHSFIQKTNDHSLVFNRLPLSFYPEYRKVYELMTCTSRDGCDCYVPFCCYKLIEIKFDGTCILESMKNLERIAILASSVVIVIGSSPDLSFLTDSTIAGAVQNGTYVDYNYQSNPIKVDPYTYEVIDQPDMYAMGPLVGDNFVRFITGGAFGIASSIVKKANLF
ncbi:Oxidative stress-induced growth inhibitor 2 [Trichoplax sp. H2]|uniref:Uncharacterized protein n=1 Tax=Trichoplax adhaerens TaxID=10228 RepID=B3RIR9_TRIAD|nr:hypothetical protein TRIADDRAFT_52503 [Trichoplax adhaerens]EDV29029.1 hypothetical protein TRIADDRAFT_52503 [Trichoplax adhaerens]RDD47121.1 Oxidative stress-induced growth inhibitor 2 [Trichoplax sp. H2]|eukprot:XP_002108231.1 hypothetical protein TRIADDRAFT_52503 [Trichoplax adhaerens]